MNPLRQQKKRRKKKQPLPCSVFQLPVPDKGFTLMELIIVIVILGVLGAMGVNFISKAFEGFRETGNRTDIYEEGKIALFRMEREIHNCLPNAVNVSGTDIEFGMIDEVAMRNVFGIYDENPPTTTLTDLFVLPPISNPAAFLPVNAIISIYNRNWNDFTSPPYRLYQVNNVTPGGAMTISNNLTPPRSSPLKRYYAVDKVIRYQFAANVLSRSTAPITTSGPGVYSAGKPLAKNVSSLNFSYVPASLTRNALVVVDFTIAKGGEAVSFHKEIHVRNVP